MNRYVILDDFVCAGNTINGIVDDMEGQGVPAECMVGIILYKGKGNDWYEDDPLYRRGAFTPCLRRKT